MAVLKKLGSALLGVALLGQGVTAQLQGTSFTHEETGITFTTWSSRLNSGAGQYVTGLVLPEDSLKVNANEYIGYMRCHKSTTWCGMSHGESGQMTRSLLMMAWPSGGEVLTQFRFATGYVKPSVYTGDAKVTQIWSNTEAGDYWELIYRCEGCYSWEQDGVGGQVSTAGSGFLVIGRAASSRPVSNTECPTELEFDYHNEGQSQFGADISDVASESYSEWAAMATNTVMGNCEGEAPTSSVSASSDIASTFSEEPTSMSSITSSSTPPTSSSEAPATWTSYTCQPAPTAQTYDYIVVGGGAGGIPMADRLSEAGHSVLLIEKGDVSTGRWGGTLGPDWLDGTNLTRFDVPGLCNQIWHDSAGIACSDIDQMAGCLLGGGTAVNAGLWWKPNPKDWDENFPESWHAEDTVEATDRVFERIPGAYVPSMDGFLYHQEGYNVLASGLEADGWEFVIPNNVPTEKNHTYGHTAYMFSHGERGGPLATYLVTANERENFGMWTNTSASRIMRDGGKALGVDVQCSGDNGYSGQVSLSENGRVIVSAGTFGTPKLLFRSGIGPEDELKTVQSSADTDMMISEESWIDLPVGYGLVDHVNTDLVMAHPDVVFYDFYEAWDDPIESDEEKYLNERAGILAQAAPNIGPMMWDEVTTSDGKVRQLQWTSRVEGGELQEDGSNTTMIMSQYLGRGSTSRGRVSITEHLDMYVSEVPFFNDEHDLEAVIMGIKNLQAALSNVPNLTWIWPEPGQTAEEYVASIAVTASGRRSNHWMGTAKMSGLGDENDGSSVVDTTGKVFGTDNIFIMDASIFPGQPTGNPSCMVVIAAEHISQKILAL